MTKVILLFIALCASMTLLNAQNVGINADGSAPANSAMLDVKSTSKGFLLPRMTIAQRDAIVNPDEGLIVFCTDCGIHGALAVYSDSQWRSYQDCITATPTAGTNVTTVYSIQWVWVNSASSSYNGVQKYKWNTTNNLTTANDMGTSTSTTEAGLDCYTPYTRYVWAISGCGISAPVTLTATTLVYTGSPDTAKGTPSPTQIVWKWKTVAGATGYKWNSTNNYATATNIDNVVTYTQTGLTGATKYNAYVWAVTNCGYNPNPATLTEITPAGPCDPAIVNYEGVTYHTLQIGAKCWMKENLNIGTRINGNTDMANNSVIEKYCYNDKEDSCSIYGGLYQWNEAMQWVTTDGAQGICPSGWHIPTKTESDALLVLVGNLRTGQQGKVLKEVGFVHWEPFSTYFGTDDIGFTAMGSGQRGLYTSSGFTTCRQYAHWWNSTQNGTYGWMFLLNYTYNGSTANSSYQKTYGFSVRCVKN